MVARQDMLINYHPHIPTVSRLAETGKISKRGMVPYEGRNPIMPQKPAGTLTPPTESRPVIKCLHERNIQNNNMVGKVLIDHLIIKIS